MGKGILTNMIGSLNAAAGKLLDSRKPSNDTKYQISDALKSGLAVFYLLNPSMLAFQKSMKKKYKRDNLDTLFGVKNIPSSDQIKNIVDEIDPKDLESVFDDGLRLMKKEGVFAQYRVLDGEIPVAVDGTWHYSSRKVSCDHCLTMTTEKKDGSQETLYYHDVVAMAIVRYNSSVVIPLVSEFVRNEDGTEKQDCERNAFKRNLARRSSEFRELKPIFLGDDLYSCHSICSDINGRGMSFIFTCKNESHPWIVEQTDGAPFETYKRTEWNGRNHLQHRYKWVNGIENRADPHYMLVNYLDYEIWNEEKGEVTYHNSWITNKMITASNVVELTKVARSRWKIENEHNNVLKHRGYNLKHNFGHGKNHAADIYCMLHQLSFLIHAIQDLCDEQYKAARATFSSRAEFFAAMRHEINYHFHTDWAELLILLGEEAPDG
jgi:hypothetical protein